MLILAWIVIITIVLYSLINVGFWWTILLGILSWLIIKVLSQVFFR